MLRTLAVLLFSMVFTLPALAQFPGAGPTVTGKITGKLLDAETKSVIPYATVTLFKKQAPPKAGQKADSIASKPWKQVNGALTEDNGSFKLKDVAPGEYKIEISFLGYDKKAVEISTTGAKPDYDLGTVSLNVSAEILEGVTVTGEREMIENHVDKVVFNAENDPSLAGGDATDVLRKTPMLSVDLDGNLSLRGSSNVRLLINGKPSTLFSGSVAEALRSIPADEIKKVEVITVPTAKYEGEGTGGIVNIITKRKGLEGFKGSVNVNTSFLRGIGGGGNATLGVGRFGVNASLYGNHGFKVKSSNDLYRETFGENPTVLQQNGAGKSAFDFLSGKIGAFYDFNAFNSLNTSLNLRNFSNSDNSIAVSQRFNTGSATPFEEIVRNSLMDNSNGSFDWTTDYRRTFDGSEREIALAFQLSGNLSESYNRFSEEGRISLANINTNDSKNFEYTYQADFIEPFGKWGKLELGGKAVIRRLTSDFSTYLGSGLSPEQLERDPTQSDMFEYNQDVYGGYASLNSKLGKKWGVVTGLRYEHTQIGFDFRDDIVTASNDYGSILPSAIVSYTLNPMSTLKASYTRRIQRPSLFYLNPYLRQNSTLFISKGNPKLEAELTDQVELAYNTVIKQNSVNASIFYRTTHDAIEPFQALEVFKGDTVTQTSYLNVGNSNSFGANLFTNINITKWASLFLNADVSTYYVESPTLGLSNSGASFGGNGGFNFKFGKGWKANTFTYYRSESPTLQGTRPGYMFMNLGIQKDIWKEKGSISLSVSNPFQEYIEFGSEARSDNFYQESVFRRQQRDLRLSFRYSFGDMKFRQRNRNSKISNDDVKSGGGQSTEGN